MRKFLSITAGLSFLAASNSFGTDPGAHTIRMRNNTDNAMVNATIGANLTYTQATHTLSAAGGSVVRTVTAKWNDLAGGALATGSSKLAVTVPYSGTITGWNISADTGTCTVKWWKKATGRAIPIVSDVINTSGVALATGTHIRSSTVTDFGANTTVTAGDMFIGELTAISGATWVVAGLEITSP